MSPAARFCAVTVAVSGLFWVAGAVWPGDVLVDGLPVSAGMFVAPAVAAWATWPDRPALPAAAPRRVGRALGLAAWSATMPAVLACSWLLLRASGSDVPAGVGTSWAGLVALCVVFTVSSTCEELGWTRWLTYRLLARWQSPRWSVLGVGLAVGALWAAVHVVPYAQAGRSAGWIAWQCAFTVAFRVLVVAAVLRPTAGWPVAVALHASYDVAWAAFPVGGSHYDPRTVALLTLVAAAVAVGHHVLRSGQEAAGPLSRTSRSGTVALDSRTDPGDRR